MAKSINKSNVAMIQQSGKVGTVRFFQRNGETYVRCAHNSVSPNPRTRKQILQRLLFSSRITLWRALKNELKDNFTLKPEKQSAYNAFMQINGDKGVYFTKQQMAKGAQVIFPIRISDGQLKSIVTTMVNGQLRTNIQVGSLVITPNTSIGEFSNAIVAANNFRYDDALVFVSITQTIDDEGIPKIISEFHELVLSKGDTRKVFDVVSASAFQSINGFLGSNPNLPTGCFAYVHTRNEPRFMISSQILVSNNEVMITHYTSEEQFQQAWESYGGTTECFLRYGSRSYTFG